MRERGKFFATRCQLTNVEETMKLIKKKKRSCIGSHRRNNLFRPESAIDAGKLDKPLGKIR